MNAPALDRWQLLAYGLPGLPLAVLSLPLAVYLPTYLSRELGLSVLVVGAALLLARLFDVVSDLAIGRLSDRARRHGLGLGWFMAAGIPLLLLGIAQLFTATPGLGFTGLLFWNLLAYLGWTLIAIPYYAWGAELAPGAHGRTRLAGSREGFAIAGTAAVIFLPALYGIADQPGAVLAAVTSVMVWLLPAAVLISLLAVPPAPAAPALTSRSRRLWDSLKYNRPLQRLLGAYTLSNIANAMPATLFLFYIAQVLEAEARTGLFLGLYFLAGILALPGWIWLAHRHGRLRVWVAAMLLAALAFAVTPWLGAGDLVPYALVCVLTGIALGADLALPASLQADMVDLDHRHAGERRAGLLFGLWGLATKLAAALGVGLAFLLLAGAGFDPDGANDADTLHLLALLYGAAPVLLKLLSIALLWRTALAGQDIHPDRETDHVPTPAAPVADRRPADGMHHHATR